MVHKVESTEDFKSQLEAAGQMLVVVDFFATWCGPCKIMVPKLEELSKKYSDKIVVIKVDVDECEELAVQYEIASMPTFVFIKNSEKIDSFSGANEEMLTKFIEKYI